MNKILQDLINTRKVASFINNVIVRMEKKEGYDEVVKEILKRLAENNLYVKLEKYKQKIREVEFLGVVIGPERIKMKKEKVKRVLDWLTVKGVKNIQKFLGLTNYYWQFIKDFATIARPLYDLVKKDYKQDWIERQKKIFQKLKKRFTKELVLAVPDLDKKIRMEVNVLDYAMGGILSIKCKNRKQKLVVFLSKSLNETERNYKIYNKNILAVVRELENQRHLLEGTKYKF